MVPGLEGTFLSEGYLTQIEDGPATITREKMTIHYCPTQRTERDGKILKTSHYAHSVWVTSAKNPADRRWYCLKCVKAANKGEIDFPANWFPDDIRLIKEIDKTNRKKKADHKLEIRRNGDFSLHKEIQTYINERNSKLRRIERNHKSYFHYEHMRDSGYLKTAVLTALEQMGQKPHERKAKGGKPQGSGAKSVAKWHEANFVRELPVETSIQSIGVEKIIFNRNSIQDILQYIKYQEITK